ncbi:hypothetical protein HY641_00945 [Candidatus Woesearchaeota archaeon]|nr:hypothetical protein [Candidatus Woesearchaeota archaeon]
MAIKQKPSAREKKRYVGFEIISKSRIPSLSKVQKQIVLSMIQYKGELGASQAGAIVVPERWDQDHQQGILRVNRKRVNDAIAALTLTRRIDGGEVVIRTTGTSGMIAKAQNKRGRALLVGGISNGG